MVSGRSDQVPFQAHIELLRSFLAHRDQIVEKIQGLLNAQDRPLRYRQDRSLLSGRVEDCFFTLAATGEQACLRGQLQQVHWESGFRPREMPGLYNDLVDPGEMMIRAFSLWKQTRWPGRNGRVRYAQTLFNLYLLRNLELLVMRLWDEGPASAGDRLTRVQGVLDELRESTPADQPLLVRDARWLIPLAQSPTTDELAPYFKVSGQIEGSLSEDDRLEIRKASVLMAGGHLRSQLRYYTMKGASLATQSVVLESRRSNALDFAITIQGLVPILDAYAQAMDSGDRRRRLELAGVICQGISPDPELFVNRIDLLGPYTMIEHLFITTDQDGRAVYTPMGQRHLQLLHDYAARISRLAPSLYEDCPAFRPVRGAYSPYGIMFGFSSNITEHMALKALLPEAVTGFGIEDAFTEEEAGTGKLAWVSGWRKLPHVKQELLDLYEYPQQFAEEIFGRIELALRTCATGEHAKDVSRTGRLFILSGGDPQADSKEPSMPGLSVQYVVSSDAQFVAAGKARSCDQTRLLHDRQEGELAVSYRTPGGWAGISKDFLTEVLGAGRDVKVVGLPDEAAAVLRLMCLELVAPAA